MNFDSVFFIACFLPLLAVLYALLRGERARNVLLLAGGLLFYAFGGLGAVLLLLAAAAVNYVFGLLLLRLERGKGKALLAAAVALDLLFLGVCKYLNFFLSALSPLLGVSWHVAGLAAPVGISFFTFKCVSYIVDTYRDRGAGTRNFFRLLLYISFFPQVMAGPITRFGDFASQLDGRGHGAENMAAGLRRFIAGLGKKLILSGAAARVANAVFAMDAAALSAPIAWAGAIAYSLQICLDFSGYSDMAIGLGTMFGFSTPENFQYPYISASVTDFWRRWHISLSSWFRDYLYIPLGGSRRGEGRAAINKLIVFTLCGLWHGAAWTFVLWGLWHGIFSALESFKAVKQLLDKPAGRALGHVYALLVACLGFVMFRAENFAGGLRMLGAMFGTCGASALSPIALGRIFTPMDVALLLLGCIGSTPLPRRALERHGTGTAARALSYAGCAVLLVLCMTELAAGGFAPFIYFQF